MTPIVLAVHFPAKQLSRLRMAAMRLGAKVRVVEKWEYLNAVGALTGDLSSFETFYDGEDFSGQLLVFAHFADERLQLFLQAMNTAKAKLEKPAEPEPEKAPEPTKEELLLTEIRDLLKNK